MTVQNDAINLRSFTEIVHSEFQMIVRKDIASYEFLQSAKPDSPLNLIYESIKGNSEFELGKSCELDCQADLLDVSKWKLY